MSLTQKDSKDQALKVEVIADGSDVESLNFKYSKQDIEEASEIFHYENKLSSKLNARLIGMIALVGVFGTGLFLSSGGTLHTTGPVGMLLGYVLVGTVVGASQISQTEVACLYPATSAYVAHAEHFVDKALGFAIGIVGTYSAIVPSELAAVSVIMTYWSDINPALWISIFGVVIIATNCYNVKWYGEIEFFFGILKILLCLGLILVGLIIDLGGVPGQQRLGFHYWKHPGPFAAKYATGSLGKFLGFWKAVSSIVYAFGGVQSIAMLAGETKFPRRAIHRAAKRVFLRVLVLYLVMVFILTLIVPYNDPVIAQPSGTASGSPWVRAISLAGIKVLPHIINAVVLTSALSAANLSIIKGSRTIYALAIKKQLPKFFLKINKHGLPYIAVGFCSCFIPLAYLTVSQTSANVFSWFQNITSSVLLCDWIVISINHIALHRAMSAQGYTRKDLPYTFIGGKYAGWYSLFFSVLFLLTGGFPVFIHGYWEFANFFSAYFVIVLAFVFFVGGKIFFKTKFLKPSDVRLKPLFYDVELRSEPPFKKLKGWEWLTLLWG
ncbi:hypothetical protein KGF57_003530 [Candida theae]|uniref:Amino acid permease/ SLC12A domain-containing protein n=1 Tax=Candida theae TaxID=1198502 RepID=A0AAD5FXV0_9ASCO|nr:uncharacterized protein KGF57_003530 [Candida theae]KAI5956044.1 hypothetical protein KGF57_003530 [Candida theae]